jgi:hypothetical protein
MKVANYLIRGFGGISTLSESTHLGIKLESAKNILLRPWGGFKGLPIYQRLWALGASSTIHSTITALKPPLAKAEVKTAGGTVLRVFQNFLTSGEIVRITAAAGYPSVTIGGSPHTMNSTTDYYIRSLSDTECGLSLTAGGTLLTFNTAFTGTEFLYLQPQRVLDTTDDTVALIVSKHGKNFLVFYNIDAQKARGGPFYLGDDGTYTGTVDFTSTGAAWEVLATRLDGTARWNAQRFFGQTHVHNGVDTPAIVQLARNGVFGTPGRWRPSGDNARPAAPVIRVQAPATTSNVQAFWTIAGGAGAGQRAGSASLTFTAHPVNFPGVYANSKIQVRILYVAYATGISSTISGAGTALNPYLYTITTGPGAANNSNNALVAYVNADSKVISILSASTSASDNTDQTTGATTSWAATALTGGSGSGVSVGFANRTVTAYARYWDVGVDGLGYEGPSSPISNTIILDALSANDIVVTVTRDPSAGGGRFGYIRIYLQFGEDAEAIWVLVDPDNPETNNTTGSPEKVIGSDTLFGQTMYVDQNQALPGTNLVQANGQMWRGGNPDYPNRLYVSKPATEDEMAPEGANVDAYELLQSSGSVGGNRVTAMYSDNYRVAVHTPGAVTLIDPANPLSQYQPPTVAGAINATALCQWVSGDLYYLGSDLQLYQFNGSRYGKNDTEFAAQEAAAYVMARADRTAVQNNPERVFMFPDVRGQMIWFFVPALDGTLKGFAYDFLAKGLVGEFDYPKIHGLTAMEPSRPEFVFCDESLNLFVWDTSAQYDFGDTLPVQAAFTSYATPDTAPVGDAGYGHVTWGAADYRRAYIAEFETGLIDMSQPALRKQFMSLMWNTVVNSRALVEVTITAAAGQTITRTYGDIGSLGQGRAHKLAFLALDTSCKIKLRILAAEQKAWTVRDLALQYRTGKQV